jgi:hypothetical protein
MQVRMGTRRRPRPWLCCRRGPRHPGLAETGLPDGRGPHGTHDSTLGGMPPGHDRHLIARDLLRLDPGFEERVARALLSQPGDARNPHSVALPGVPLIRSGMAPGAPPPPATRDAAARVEEEEWAGPRQGAPVIGGGQLRERNWNRRCPATAVPVMGSWHRLAVSGAYARLSWRTRPHPATGGRNARP